LAQHRALVGFELEVLAKKMDRFGWERDRGTPAHDRMVTDWMNALQDYPLAEVQGACRSVVLDNPSRMPNEGHIRAAIQAARKRFVEANRRHHPEPPRARPTPKAGDGDAILEAAGFRPRKFGGAT